MGHLTYLGMLAPWALVVLLLQWMIGFRPLRELRRQVAIAAILPAAYLVIADSVAISQGIWTLHDDRILGLRLGNVPVEEALFFLVTNLMVVQSVVLLSDLSLRRRAAALVRRLAPRSRSAAITSGSAGGQQGAPKPPASNGSRP